MAHVLVLNAEENYIGTRLIRFIRWSQENNKMSENLPEAPASLNFIFDLRTKEVSSIQITLRGKDESEVVERARQLMRELGVGKSEPKAATVSKPETWGEVGEDAKRALAEVRNEVEEFDVLENPTGELQYTTTGKKYMKVRGGRWTKYGVSAWPEIIPFEDWEEWQVGQPYNLPLNAVVAMKEKDGRMMPDKVIRFE